MATEYTLSYTAAEINEKLGKVDSLVSTVNGVKPDASGNINISAGGGGSAIIDVVELPTENIRDDVFYRLMTASLILNQRVQNAYTCYCVESLPEVGEPATNIDQTEGNVYYTVGDGEVYGYVDDTLSAALGVSVGWYPAATLFGALGYEYAGVVTNILDDPIDDKFRLLLEYITWSYKEGWVSHKTIGMAGTGTFAEVFNYPANEASGVGSHAEGVAVKAEGYCSHAEGSECLASGECSHAEGRDNIASGDYSHAEGYGTIAATSASHAEGSHTSANGSSAHSEGIQTKATGFASHAEGMFAQAHGYFSHAEGYQTTASSDHQHVQGKYNVEDSNNTYAHIIGNGTVDSDRSNAHTLDWSGNAWFAGDVYIKSTSGTNKDDGSLKLATESYVQCYVEEAILGGAW